MQLAGNDLHDIDVTGMAHLTRGQIEGAVAILRPRQIDFGLNLIRFQLPNHAFWAAYSNLSFRDGFGADLQLWGDVLKHDRRTDGDFGRLFVARDHEPHARSQQQREKLEPEIVYDISLEESDHGWGSESDFRGGAGSMSGDSS